MEQLIKQFESQGYNCIIKMLGFDRQVEGIPNRWYTGYVCLHETHPAYNMNYSEPLLENISVHGGLTYAAPRLELVDDPCDDMKYWYIGFDCNHLGDNPISENADYVAEELISLAYQLKQMEVEYDKA